MDIKRLVILSSLKKIFSFLILASFFFFLSLSFHVNAVLPIEEDYELKLLGKYIFFDELSNPPTMSCATCHAPRTGGTGDSSRINRKQVAITGANPHTVGSLRPPTNSYASFIMPFQSCERGPSSIHKCGGNFYDGRSVGFGGESNAFSTEVIDPSVIPVAKRERYLKYLGPVADQALNPFPNEVEQNISALEVCMRVAEADYSALYKKAWGEPISCDEDFAVSFKRIAIALSAYQSSYEINSFSSKFDVALLREHYGWDKDSTPGEFPLVGFTRLENLGHDLFYGQKSKLNPEGKNANCAVCHTNDSSTDTGAEFEQLFIDQAFHGLGVPKNYDLTNPETEGLEGLAGHTGIAEHRGARRTPTLRNVDKRPYRRFVKSYTANGWFKSLESLVHFYNTADTRTPEEFAEGLDSDGNPIQKLHTVTLCPENIKTERKALANNCWPKPEFPETSNRVHLGNLGLTKYEEKALVAYLKTFTDHVTAYPPIPYKYLKRFKN